MDAKTDSIVALDRFILSTRESGYKGTSSAISELVDNALQAGANDVRITIASGTDGGDDLVVTVLDNGVGMDRKTLVQALRFGGSSRYNDRQGLGRFGMGLPNASLGQARRVDVYTWQGASAITSYLDVDEIATGRVVTVPAPRRLRLSQMPCEAISVASGTCIVWSRCDRLDNKRPSTVVRKLMLGLGRTFRYFLLSGARITVNGKSVVPIDPLYLHDGTRLSGARRFQDNWTCEIYADPADENSSVGIVKVTFSELPVDAWGGLSNERKREMGVANGAGVSIVRAGREVDYGWFFMGSKRRENYDDWWRCEIQFDPVLDEAFGITHTKQQIRPKDYLAEALTPYIEGVAKALNGRVRQSHTTFKTSKSVSGAEQLAADRNDRMKPLPAPATVPQPHGLKQLIERHSKLRQAQATKAENGSTYHLIEDELADACFFNAICVNGAVVGVMNPRHAFYRSVYGPIIAGGECDLGELAKALQLVLLAAARAEISFTKPSEKAAVEAFRREWSHSMDVLLSKK
jgi:hypothetical protein